MATSPPLSFILVTPDDYSTIAPSVANLRRQTIADQVELVIVHPRDSLIQLDARDRATFANVKLVPYAGPRILSQARACGIRNASAPFVAIAEDHSFPSPNAAELFLQQHGNGHTVVGPAMSNLNPASAISHAAYLGSYGPWNTPAEPGTRCPLPGHNSSYNRQALLDFGDELADVMAAETIIQWELRDTGHSLYLEPRIVAAHVNPSHLCPVLLGRVHAGRVFAALWSRHWPLTRRLYFALISPLMTFKGFLHAARLNKTQASDRSALFRLRTFTLLIPAYLATCLGFTLGFLTRAGRSVFHDWGHEMKRDRFLSRADLKRMKRYYQNLMNEAEQA